MIINCKIPENPKYKYELNIKVDWPNYIEYEGGNFFYVREGTRIRDDCPSAKYSNGLKEIFLGLDGQINED